MDDLIFEWDEAKAAANLKKHGVAFTVAAHVFSDPYCLTAQDRFENGEYRWQSIGTVGNTPVLVVAHVWRNHSGSETIRIISARKATRQERKHYENSKI